MTDTVLAAKKKRSFWVRLGRNMRQHPLLYLMIAPVILYFLLYHYYPMYGLQIAFRNYKAAKGIWGSQWVGLKNFERFF